jgi:hypothetical protein
LSGFFRIEISWEFYRTPMRFQLLLFLWYELLGVLVKLLFADLCAEIIGRAFINAGACCLLLIYGHITYRIFRHDIYPPVVNSQIYIP